MARLLTASPKFKILVANLQGSGNPSKGLNPTKIRTGFEKQMLREIAQGTNRSEVDDPSTPGLHTQQGLLTYSGATPVGCSGTITVADNDFTDAATLSVGQYTITSGEDFTVGTDTQATADMTVLATPSTADLTIGGQVLTAAGGARTPGNNDYDGTLGTVDLIAAEIATAITDPANGYAAIATVLNLGGPLIRLQAVPVGTAGNALVTTSSTGDVLMDGATFVGGINAITNSATVIASAIGSLPGFDAVSVGTVLTVTGPSGPAGNDILFTATYRGTVQNFTLSPDDGFFDGAEPFVGPPTILP